MKLLILCLFIALSGCIQPQHLSKTDTRNLSNGLAYVKDGRTGLCFATITGNNGHFGLLVSITNVPCSPDVERLIKP